MEKRLFYIILILLLFPVTMEAQCSMCRAVLETESTQSAAKGINDGIMYLMIFPYLLMCGVAYFVWRAFKKSDETSS